MAAILPPHYYHHEDVLHVSRDLLGKYLLTQLDGNVTGGMIIETEAYRGPEDKASHAYNNRRTPRNEVMYAEGGIAYVYFCYGLHNMFNIVTNKADIPHAVLIRAILPEIGIETMLERRQKQKLDKTLTSGPGATAQALGITRALNGSSLTGPQIWLEDRNIIIPEEAIIASERVGIDYAGEHAKLLWRFRIKPRLN